MVQEHVLEGPLVHATARCGLTTVDEFAHIRHELNSSIVLVGLIRATIDSEDHLSLVNSLVPILDFFHLRVVTFLDVFQAGSCLLSVCERAK